MFSQLSVAEEGNKAGAKKPQLIDKIVAIVDNDIIMLSELNERIVSIKNRLSRQGTPLPPDDVVEQRVLDQLILEAVQLQLANMVGIRVPDEQLNETLENIARSNNMTMEQFEAQLALEGESYTAAREQIRREMIISRIQKREVDRRVRVTEQEVKNFAETMDPNSSLDLIKFQQHVGEQGIMINLYSTTIKTVKDSATSVLQKM